ncbi:MAG: hypothetical protein Q4Q04_03485, partial [Methanocorpusculum sp.]|nr:hypothetical protein [Methanocorpusculum sp.]
MKAMKCICSDTKKSGVLRFGFLLFVAVSLVCVSCAAADNDIWIVPGSGGDVISVWKGVTTTFQVTTVTRDAGGMLLSIGRPLSPSDVVWSSSNPSVGTFSGGEFSALDDGETQITAAYNGWSDTTAVYVTSSPKGTIYLNPTTVAAGETAHFIFAAYDTSSGQRLTDDVLQTRWSAVDAGGGSFANPSSGDYTAPASVGTYTIEARGTAAGYTTYYAAALVNVVLPAAPAYAISGPSSAVLGESVVFTPSHVSGCYADSIEWTVAKSGAPDMTFTSWTLAHAFSGTGDYIIRMKAENTTYGLFSSVESLSVRVRLPEPTYVPPSATVPAKTVSPTATKTASPVSTVTAI